MKNLAIPLLAATTQAQRPASMALDIQDQGPNPVGYLGGLTGLVAHETVADSDPVEYVCVYPEQDDINEMARLKQAVVDAEEAVQNQENTMNEKAVTDADTSEVTGTNGVVELLRLAQVERQAQIEAADLAREAIYVTVADTPNNAAATESVTLFARAEEAERLLREAQEAYRVAQVNDVAQGELVDSLTSQVENLLVAKNDLAATTTQYMNEMNSAHLSIAIERQRHIIELCRVQASGWTVTAASEAAAIATFRTELLAQWWSLQSTADQQADEAAWGALDAAGQEAWYDRSTRADLETTTANSEAWQNWANTSTVERAAYFADATEQYAWSVQNGVNKVANASTLYARAVDISPVYWAEIANVAIGTGQSDAISAIPARCIIPPRKFLVNDNSDHTIADAGDAFDATDDAIGDTFEDSERIRIDPDSADTDVANSLTRKMEIADAALTGATSSAVAIAAAELIQRWRQVNMEMIDTLIADNKYRSELTGGAITPSTSDACNSSSNLVDHSALCTGELEYSVSAAAAFTTQWQKFVAQNLMFEQIFAYDEASLVDNATTVAIGAVVSPGTWARDNSSAIDTYLLAAGTPPTVTDSSPQPAWPDAYYVGTYEDNKDATDILGAFDDTDGDADAWAWYQSAATLSEATRKMYVESARAATAGNGVYFRIADACTDLVADALTDSVGGWTGSGTSADCAALCDAKQAYYKVGTAGDRDSLPDLTAADDGAAVSNNSSTHCFGYKWTAEVTPSTSNDAKCDLGVQYTSFDAAAVDVSGTSAAANVCMARFASMAVYGTAALLGSTGTLTPGSISARALNGGDGSVVQAGFSSGYVEAYKNHYGARATNNAGAVTFDSANDNYATPGANSIELTFRTMIAATGDFTADTDSGILKKAKAYAEERVKLLEMGFFAWYATNEKNWIDALGTSSSTNDAQRYPKAYKIESDAKTAQDSVVNYQGTLTGLQTDQTDATTDLTNGVALVTAASDEVAQQLQAYNYAKADYDAAKLLSDAAEGALGQWQVQTDALGLATTNRGTESTPADGTTRKVLESALQAFDDAFAYEASAAPPTLFDALNSARGDRDAAVTAFNSANTDLFDAQVVLDGLADTLKQAEAAVVADDLKCKSENFDAYTRDLLSRQQARADLLDDIQAFIESDTPPAAGTAGARCEKALSNGTFRPSRYSGAADPDSNQTCVGETACCGASRVPLSDGRGFLTVETCGTTDQETYTYTYPRKPLAKVRDQTVDVTFTCIEGAQRLAAAAAAAATALYMLA